MIDNQKSDDDDVAPRPPARASTFPPAVGKSSATSSASVMPGRPGPSGTPGVGKTSLTATLAPLPPPSALQDPALVAQVFSQFELKRCLKDLLGQPRQQPARPGQGIVAPSTTRSVLSSTDEVSR